MDIFKCCKYLPEGLTETLTDEEGRRILNRSGSIRRINRTYSNFSLSLRNNLFIGKLYNGHLRGFFSIRFECTDNTTGHHGNGMSFLTIKTIADYIPGFFINLSEERKSKIFKIKQIMISKYKNKN